MSLGRKRAQLKAREPPPFFAIRQPRSGLLTMNESTNFLLPLNASAAGRLALDWDKLFGPRNCGLPIGVRLASAGSAGAGVTLAVHARRLKFLDCLDSCFT